MKKVLSRYVASRSFSELSLYSCNWIAPTSGLQEALHHLSAKGHHLDTAYASFLRQSKSPVDVQHIHDHAISTGHDRGTFLGNVLVQMYAKHGDLSRAQSVFENIWERNVYSWNIIIAAYASNGHFDAAVDMFYEMEREATRPNRVTFLAVLGACSNLRDLEEARRIHGLVTRFRLHTEVMVCNALINAYGKCGSIDEARQVFDTMHEKNVVSWTTMIGTYGQDERHAAQGIQLYHRMDVPPTEVTFITVLEACASVEDVAEGRSVHARIKDLGFQPQVIAGKLIGNALVNMYGRCGSLAEAREVFDHMQHRDVAAWNAMLSAYARGGHTDAAIHTLRHMDLLGLKPNHITFTSAISAFCGKRMYSEGVKLHERVADSGTEPDIILQNSLITMYSRCGSLDAAYHSFSIMQRRNTQSWNAIIGACVQHGEFHRALHIFHHMEARQDPVTFLCVLGACSSPTYLTEGSVIHERAVSAGLEQDPVVGSALVNMYSKCGGLDEAKSVFDRLTWKTVVSWTAMIDAFVQLGYGSEALKLFRYMEMEGWKPNDITYIGLLGACSAIGAFSQGKAVHGRVRDSGSMSDVIRVALVSLYGKCAKVEEAREIFQELRQKPAVAWNAMISAYAQQGYGAEAVILFYDMVLEGAAEANEITFLCLLSGCSHEGLVDKSWEFFRSMSGDYGLSPSVEHHGTMVDILARQGHLQRAEELLTTMPFQADVVAWTSLLGACKTHSDTERGARVATRVFELDKEKSGAPYSLLTNIFSEAGKVNEAYDTCKLMEARGARRQTARSFIEVNNRIHEFVVGDASHPENERIRAELKRLHEMMKLFKGYTPDRQVVLHNVDEQEKEGLLMFHSERLAVAYGLLSSRTGTSVRVVKNIRVCSDCHSVIKLISELVQRKIVLRDANRFHHFQHGSCSCKDYW